MTSMFAQKTGKVSGFVSENGHSVHFRTVGFFIKRLIFKEIIFWHSFCLQEDRRIIYNTKRLKNNKKNLERNKTTKYHETSSSNSMTHLPLSMFHFS